MPNILDHIVIFMTTDEIRIGHSICWNVSRTNSTNYLHLTNRLETTSHQPSTLLHQTTSRRHTFHPKYLLCKLTCLITLHAYSFFAWTTQKTCLIACFVINA
jgi:hypothetical protein